MTSSTTLQSSCLVMMARKYMTLTVSSLLSGVSCGNGAMKDEEVDNNPKMLTGVDKLRTHFHTMLPIKYCTTQIS